MNAIVKILLGALILAALACLWIVLTQKNRGGTGCSGSCAGCASPCADRKSEEDR